MALSERTIKKLRAESVEAGSTIYEDDQDAHEVDVTHFEEDDSPHTLARDFDGDGDVDEDDRPVGQVPDAREETS